MSDTEIKTDLKALTALTPLELHDLFRLRIDVFVVEQKCPYPEIDGQDINALHLRLMKDNELIAATRILPPKSPGKPVKIGRVVVSPNHRGQRLGEKVMRESIDACHSNFPGTDIFISAQSHLKSFYNSLGFQKTSDEYVEDGIAHIDMVLAG
ncbi:GNAT family N-acetyltransferase [Rhizobium sp. L1K21]|uniref:GNAT family N-acetyltransferase n=1 Tax=Rhizobium sp. L1K21 TaxID=2954933 RepID=UPI0020925A08|nr:GNAT family N-acetyltransferase [Rhizobium sp. L1K21]MCO6185969.1 GNAT family N-acetyltransferase [Rhizobium sp. L1K21]